MEILENFVVFEGIDGSGTTTQIGVLEGFFRQGQFQQNPLGQEKPAIPLPALHTTFEPTDGPIGTLLRSALRGEVELSPRTVALLFAADRNEHIYGRGGIAERCGRGELVVSDRYLPSSLVYQGISCGEDFPALLNRDFPAPEILLYFDIDPEAAQKRLAGRRHRDIFEYLDFQVKARERYKAMLPGFSAAGVRVATIDAALPPEEVGREVLAVVAKMPIFKR